MNCQPGDLAIVVSGINAGALPHILRRSSDGDCEWEAKCLSWAKCVRNGVRVPPGTIGDVPDSMVRPIRRGDVTDEEVAEPYAAGVLEVVRS